MKDNPDTVVPRHEGTAHFHTTMWNVVLDAGNDDPEQSDQALEALCKTYWYPVYAFLRRKSYTPHDAQDLTQGFFAHLLERNTLENASPEKGRFRSFLLGSLKLFLGYETRKRNALKRGGKTTRIAIDEHHGEDRFQSELAHNLTPERLYHRSWADELLQRVLATLKTDYNRTGRSQLFNALQPYISGEDNLASYRDLAGELGLTPGAVTTSVYRLRRRYAELLREQIAHTVADPDQIDDELNFLFTVVAE